MAYIVGISLALLVGLFASLVGFDRDRSFYPVVTIVIASTYELFAVMGGSLSVLGMETVLAVGFMAVSVLGFKTNLWLIVGALAGHGVFDFLHPELISNPGVPAWWPMFCLSYDLAAALYLAWRLGGSSVAARVPAMLEHFPAKCLRGSPQKMRPNKDSRAHSDSIEAECALTPRSAGGMS
jgi:hypothetical protein